MPLLDTTPTQDWGPSTNYKEYSYNAGTVSPAISAVAFVIKDVIVQDTNAYSDYRLKTAILYSFGDPVAWVDPSSYEDHGYYQANNFYVPYNYGMDFSFTPVFQNLAALPVDSFTLQHKFTIQGLNTSGQWQDLDTYTYETIMTVVSVIVEPSPVFSFAPASLAYEHQQNTTLPKKIVAMTGNLWKIEGKPNFIITTATAGVTIATVGSGATAYQTASGSGNAFIEIALSTYYNGTGVFSPTDLAGTFEVYQNNVFFGNVSWTINVIRLADFFNIPYPTGEKAFTLDTKYYEFNSAQTGTYFQFDATIKTYDFFTNVLNEYLIPEKVVLFQGKAKVNLGQLIHRLMRKFEAANETLLQYKLATLSVTCSEILMSDESILRIGTAPDVSFVAGLSRGITNLGFLDFNPLANRGTKNGFAILNILYPSGNYELRTFKNGTLVSSVALPASTDTIVCKKVSFSAFAKGDVIQYVVDVVGETNALAPKKTFKFYPEGNHSNTIVWQNEFLLQSALECTGTASIKSDFEFLSQKVYENLVEKLDHLSSAKEVKLYINTGWLLKTDVDTIESLMRSKRAWLLNSKGNISLRPIAKPMVNEDLERELIEFSLEFIINRNYDEETYSL
jgi:hypothetical protein